mmetsp:Transcript_8962/g.23769  ORF Transcript_8962/g.23769 Transcript_8962/m.23769 type:complete len:254 (+) Transcript_8962:271-1032(+)
MSRWIWRIEIDLDAWSPLASGYDWMCHVAAAENYRHRRAAPASGPACCSLAPQHLKQAFRAKPAGAAVHHAVHQVRKPKVSLPVEQEERATLARPAREALLPLGGAVIWKPGQLDKRPKVGEPAARGGERHSPHIVAEQLRLGQGEADRLLGHQAHTVGLASVGEHTAQFGQRSSIGLDATGAHLQRPALGRVHMVLVAATRGPLLGHGLRVAAQRVLAVGERTADHLEGGERLGVATEPDESRQDLPSESVA